MLITRAEVFTIAMSAKHVRKGEHVESNFINDEEDEVLTSPEILVPMLFIGNTRVRDIVSTV